MFFIFSDCISTRIEQFSPKSPKSENVLSLIRMSWEEKCLKIIRMSWTAIRVTRVRITIMGCKGLQCRQGGDKVLKCKIWGRMLEIRSGQMQVHMRDIYRINFRKEDTSCTCSF